MFVLLTNDDGIDSNGLLALKSSLEEVADVAVLAPDRNWSAASHSRSFHGTLTVREVTLPDGTTALTSDGTPSDCVALALMGVLPRRPDLIVSGINRGANVGFDVTYSGTVAAAMEAVIFGFPGIAISIDSYSACDFFPAARFAQNLVPQVNRRGLPPGVLLNVNVPLRPYDEIRGVATTRLGRRIYRAELEPLGEPESGDGQRFRMGGLPPTGELLPGTDVAALAAGCISITPLHLDMTEHRFLEELRGWTLLP